MKKKVPYILPHWNAPKGVHALMTTRLGGVSQPPYNSMNLGSNTKDQTETLKKNRDILLNWMTHDSNIKEPIGFLKQVHGTDIVDLDDEKIRAQMSQGIEPEGDACITTTAGVVCAIRVADCMAVLLAVPNGVAAVHAGWRGLANGAVGKTLKQLLKTTGATAEQVVAWLGPCIGPDRFEVGEEVKHAFEEITQENSIAFKPAIVPHKWFGNLPLLAKLELEQLGVNQIFIDEHCTVTEGELFYSYRREQNVLGDTGRMAACVWLSTESE